MAALKQFFSESIGWRAKDKSAGLSRSVVSSPRDEKPHLVGEYYADYSDLTADELAASDPDADALIARSRVVSSRRL